MLVNDPAAAHYVIDPARVDLAEEFRRNPKGPYSAELMKVLHRMRWSGEGGRFVLITLDPGRRWMMGRLPDINEAEWDVFRIRWKAITGRELPE